MSVLNFLILVGSLCLSAARADEKKPEILKPATLLLLQKQFNTHLLKSKKDFSNQRIFGYRTHPSSQPLAEKANAPIKFKYRPNRRTSKDVVFSDKFDFALGSALEPISPLLILESVFQTPKHESQFISKMSKLRTLGHYLKDEPFSSRIYQLLILSNLAKNKDDNLNKIMKNLDRESENIQSISMDFFDGEIVGTFLAREEYEDLSLYLKKILNLSRKLKKPNWTLRILGRLAKNQQFLGNFSECANRYLEILQTAKTNPDTIKSVPSYHGRLVICLRLSMNFEKAEQTFQKMSFKPSNFKPEESFIWSERARVHITKGEFREAEAVLKVIQDNLGNRANFIYSDLFALSFYQGSQMVDVWESRCKTSLPGFPEYYFVFLLELARKQAYQGRYQDSLKTLNEAKAVSPNYNGVGAAAVDYMLFELEVYSIYGYAEKVTELKANIEKILKKLDSGIEARQFLLDYWSAYRPRGTNRMPTLPKQIPPNSPLLINIKRFSK